MCIRDRVREENQTQAKRVLKKDLYDLTAADLMGFDVVIDAFGAWTEDTLAQHSTSLKHLCDILSLSLIHISALQKRFFLCKLAYCRVLCYDIDRTQNMC